MSTTTASNAAPTATINVPEPKKRVFKDLVDYFTNGLFPEIQEKKVLPPFEYNAKGERAPTNPIAFKITSHVGKLHFFSPISSSDKAVSYWSPYNPNTAGLAEEFRKAIEFMTTNDITVDVPTTYIDETGKVVTEVLEYSGYYSFEKHTPILFRSRKQNFDLDAFDQMLAQYKPSLEPESILTGNFNPN